MGSERAGDEGDGGGELEQWLLDSRRNRRHPPVDRQIEVLLEHRADRIARMDSANRFAEQRCNGDDLKTGEPLFPQVLAEYR